MEDFSFADTSFFLPLRLGPTARDTLQEFIDIDVTADDLVRILHRNRVYRDLFSRFVDQKTQPRKAAKSKEEKEAEAPKEPSSPIHRLISLLGMIGSRNLILALRMHKALEGKFPLSEDGAVDLKASEYLKRAIETEEQFLRSGLDYSETAYSASVYYDWLIRHLSRRKDFKKELEPYCELIWKRALRTGLLAYFLGREVTGVTPKLAMAGGFLLHGGKLLLASRFEDYIKFETALDGDARLTPLARLLAEREKYEVVQEELSSHSLRYFDIFADLIPAVRSFREPYCHKGSDPLHYRLSALLYLADAMARSWKIPNDEKDPVLLEWAHPSLNELRLKPKTLLRVMKTAMANR
jgi:HD-like signal output (HDOD) protein